MKLLSLFSIIGAFAATAVADPTSFSTAVSSDPASGSSIVPTNSVPVPPSGPQPPGNMTASAEWLWMCAGTYWTPPCQKFDVAGFNPQCRTIPEGSVGSTARSVLLPEFNISPKWTCSFYTHDHCNSKACTQSFRSPTLGCGDQTWKAFSCDHEFPPDDPPKTNNTDFQDGI